MTLFFAMTRMTAGNQQRAYFELKELISGNRIRGRRNVSRRGNFRSERVGLDMARTPNGNRHAEKTA